MTPMESAVPITAIRDTLPRAASPTSALRPRGWPWLAWLVIVGVAAFIVVRTARRKVEPDAATQIVTMQMTARYIVGAASLHLPGMNASMLYKDARDKLEHPSYSERLRFAVLAGELLGPKEALQELDNLKKDRLAKKLEAPEASVETAAKLHRLYGGYEKNPGKPNLSPADQASLRDRLGWFGELALAPQDGDAALRAEALLPARRTFVVFVSLFLLGGLGLCVGCFLLLIFTLLALLGQLRSGLTCGSGVGGIYAEAFAIYMVLYLGLSYLARFVTVPGHLKLALSGLIMFLSLAALLWPRLRGISWQKIREDVGLTLGAQPIWQLLAGPACYLCALPLLMVGVVIMLLLMYLQQRLGGGDPAQSGGPSHPISGLALEQNPWVWVQLFFLASVAAPVVEEIMFRGVLYRHLREATHRWGGILSILASVILNSFVFAVIHPQGWLGVPVLMALAIAFSLAREWRQSLLPCMVAHGINNGIITLMLLLAAA